MGNGSSNSAYVSLDKNVVNPGDDVSGTLYVLINMPVIAQSIFINVSGREDIRWQDQVTDPQGVEHNRILRNIRSCEDNIRLYTGNEAFQSQLSSARRELGSEEQKLAVNNMQRIARGLYSSQSEVSETMAVDRIGGSTIFKFGVPVGGPGQLLGQYSFPFSFRIPEGIPGSFSYMNGTTIAKLVYDITGLVSLPGMLSSNISYTVNLHVIEKPRLMNRLACALTTNIYTCCCFNNGTVSFETSSERDTYATGEDIHVVLDVKNESSKNIKKFEISLISVLSLKAGGHSKVIESVKSTITANGLPKQKAVKGLVVALPVPYDVQQQSLGNTLRHYYYFKVTGVVDWASDAVLKVPVGVFVPSPQIPPMVIPQAPANWQPAAAPAVAIVLPQQPEQTRGLDLNQFDNLKAI